MGNRIIVLDETNGESHKGKQIREFATRRNITYIDNINDLMEELKK